MNDHFDDRTRFNWGFHDATLDCEQGWPDRRYDTSLPGTFLNRPLPDNAAYCAGYAAGQDSYSQFKWRELSSERAWQLYMLCQSVPGADAVCYPD